jgi:hypothetical protein
VGDVFEIDFTHRPEKGVPLRHTITCDREMAVIWLREVADELEARGSVDDDAPALVPDIAWKGSTQLNSGDTGPIQFHRVDP